MDCIKCKEPLTDGAKFCHHCGERQPLSPVGLTSPDGSTATPLPVSDERSIKPAVVRQKIGGETLGWILAGVIIIAFLGSLGSKTPKKDAIENGITAIDRVLDATADPNSMPAPKPEEPKSPWS